MPLVRVRYKSGRFNQLDNLYIACSELVPATFHCQEGQLTPGSIEFFAEGSGRHDGMHCDVFIDMEAYHYPQRALLLDMRTAELHAALKKLFPQTTFALWPKLVHASWASDVHDPEFDGDMSLDAAIERARDLMAPKIT